MILVDTVVWIGHLDHGDPALHDALENGRVLGHPWVVGELAVGNLADRAETFRWLDRLPGALVPADAEVRRFVERERLFGTGIGWVDAGLLASTLLTPDARLWTRDRRLHAAAEHLGVAHPG